MKPLDPGQFQEAIRARSVEWRKHVLQRMAERNIAQASVLVVLVTGDRVRDYPEDKPFASALFLGYDGPRPLHVVAALDETTGQAFIVTVYEPSLEVFEADYKIKRKL